MLTDLRQFRADLETAGVDLGMSAEALEADPGWWGTRRYTAIKNIQPVLRGTRDRLNMLFNDLVAVAQPY
ncbi:MAG: hypothetical protein M9945_04140 [Aquamicrobium sp.]|uniref:hypothetical protein n=1 Tax=Aquamicrobium sp. TaxID=1872579 RepID=UPI00349E6C61|nr:hypothetical protein [Aquamicrobium sp.]